jgi:hypothetical protein
VLDPFCGAGTTLVESERHELSPVGVDLLPLAVLVSRAKLSRPPFNDLRKARSQAVRAAREASAGTPASPLLRRAFTPTAFARLAASLESATGSASDCVRLATLSIAPRFSSLIADGGWLRETKPELAPREIPERLNHALTRMEEDIREGQAHVAGAEIHCADARAIPLENGAVDAVITSPPYPNRHDYTRVFAVELELGFGLGESVKSLRYRALRSHPEARPVKASEEYEAPPGLSDQLIEVKANHSDPRIARMLDGYFRDLHDVLRELARVVRKGGVVAMVVGNAQYSGVSIPVDDHLRPLAEQAGFAVLRAPVLRLRGNSAQQMAVHGRRASRESVVIFRR